MQSTIHLAKGINIPLNAATQKLAFIGRSSSGKSYGASKFVEQLLQNNIQTVVLDPVGIWYGLRLAADGKGKGFAIPVFGGEHGDIDLLPGSGALMASLVVEKGISAVLDVSYMRKNERKQFVTDFAETLFHLKKKHRSAIHMVIEEAQTFAPQRTIAGEERMLGAMEDIVKIGRNYGIGVTLISQRPQSIHKDCLNQTEALFCFQINGTHERKAVVDWIVEKGLSKQDIEGDLSSLKVGTCFLWSPQWLKVLKKVEILQKKTFDSGKTPETGTAVVAPRTLAPVDLKEIEASMQSVIQAKKENDPTELKREIANLKKQLEQKGKFAIATIGEKQQGKNLQQEIGILRTQLKEKQTAISMLEKNILNISRKAKALFEEAENIYAYVLKAKTEEKKVLVVNIENTAPQQEVKATLYGNKKETRIRIHEGDQSQNGHLPTGEKKILIACAQFPNGLEGNQLTVLTGYKRSSRDAYILRLSGKGYIKKSDGVVTITEEGKAELGNDYQPLPTGIELQQYWLNSLPLGERKILELLIAAYPNAMAKDDISEQSGYMRSSRDAYLLRMSAKEIIIEPERGMAKASENLF